jgi:hypothetical protein
VSRQSLQKRFPDESREYNTTIRINRWPNEIHVQKSSCFLTTHVTYTLPDSSQILLPKRYLSITTTHRQQISRKTPGHPPNNIWKLACRWRRTSWRHNRTRWVKRCLHPRRSGGVFRPNQHRLILRRSSNIRSWQTNVGCPSNIADPICVSFERLFFNP